MSLKEIETERNALRTQLSEKDAMIVEKDLRISELAETHKTQRQRAENEWDSERTRLMQRIERFESEQQTKAIQKREADVLRAQCDAKDKQIRKLQKDLYELQMVDAPPTES